jgi:uracil-DNA glycosylase family 4
MVQNNISLRESLIWQIEAGIDECIGDMPIDRFTKTTIGAVDHNSNQFDQKITANYKDPFAQASDNITDTSHVVKPISTQLLQELPQSYDTAPERAIMSAVALAEATNSILDLRIAVENFEDCTLKKTAMNTVFADGNPSAKIMFIGIVPGADEDRKGLPFLGSSGLLLDKMLASIDLDRSSCYMTNIIFWRPPGDREPTLNEVAVCIPFVERHIELILPDIIVLLGGPASKALLGMKEAITKIHGQCFEYSTSKMATPILAVPLYHPINLLSSPAYKRDAWRDLLKIKESLIRKPKI